jgi:hypothetical protein
MMIKKKPKLIRNSALFLLLVTTAFWVFALFQHNFKIDEIWLYLAMFFAPVLLILFSEWLVLQKSKWLKFFGVILLIASAIVWLLSLMLVVVGFKIH